MLNKKMDRLTRCSEEDKPYTVGQMISDLFVGTFGGKTTVDKDKDNEDNPNDGSHGD